MGLESKTLPNNENDRSKLSMAQLVVLFLQSLCTAVAITSIPRHTLHLHEYKNQIEIKCLDPPVTDIFASRISSAEFL